MRKFLIISCLVVMMFFSFNQDTVYAADTLQSIIASNALKENYNSVLVDFLVEEGRNKVPAKQRKAALHYIHSNQGCLNCLESGLYSYHPRAREEQ